MYKLNRQPLPQTTVNVCFNQGGIGDDICRLPALKYILENWSHASVTLACADYLVPIIEHFFSGKFAEVIPLSKLTYEMTRRKWLQTGDGFHTPMKTHLVSHAFRNLCDFDPKIEQMNYLQLDLDKITIERLPARYVVLTCGYTAPVRAISPDTINGIALYLKSRGYTPVFLGSKSTYRGSSLAEQIEANFSSEINYSLGVDLVGKTSLLQAGKIIAGAAAVCGLDNGLLHVAGMTDTWIIAGYTNVTPETRLPVRNNQLGYKCKYIVPDDCRACQTTVSFLPEHDFRNCVWPPEGYCSSQLTADKYIKKLEEILE